MIARRTFPVLGLIVLALFAAPLAQAQVSLTTLGTPYTQNFDSLLTTGTANPWTDNSTIPGWYAQFSATPANPTTYRADSGGSNTGAIYSWGQAGVNALTERAFGMVSSGTPVTVLTAVRFVNNTGSTIGSLQVNYNGEQWRDGGAATPVAQTTFFEYQVGNAGAITDANAPSTGWTSVSSLDFTSPTFTNTGAGVAIEGNQPANRTAKSATITVTVNPGQEIWLRWRDPNDAGNDHGLGVDDLSVTPQGVIVNAPVVPTCPATLTTTFGTATSGGVSATDADGTVISATITGITPSNPGTITLTGFTPAGGVGGTANATLDVSNTTPAGTYNVTIQWANNDGSPQTANCVVGVTVNAPPVIAKIHDVQGNGSATPIPGATVTIEGVVTGDFQPITNDNRLSGFFVQEEDADVDADPQTSEGIFVFCSACPTNVAEGQKVQVTGTVSEFNNLTEITATTAGSVVITNAGNNLAQVTSTTIDLPVAGVINDFYEAKENMLVTFVDTLTVSEYFEQSRYGRIELFEGTRPRTFNESNPPSVAGYAAHNDNLNRRRVYLDDDDNVENSVLNLTDGQQFVFHPQANGGLSARNATNTGPGVQGTDFFRGGDTVSNLTGILHWSFSGGTSPDEWRVRPVAAAPATFTPVNVRPPTPPAVGGSIRAASVNVLNYFTTLNVRGADSTAELNRQRERTSIVLCTLNPDVAALMEIENHATNATITDLLGDVNTRCGGTHPYTFVNTGGALGTDQIRVMLIYRTGVLSPVGAPLTDMDPVHNRPPTAQTFDVVDVLNPAFGKRFTAVANHAKSKGCGGASGGDLDQNDGQACFAATRLAQANRLITWVNGTVIPAASDPDVLMLGDFNAYPQETSAAAISAAGYSDLETAFLGSAAYSYLFDGQIGHIDYAWSSSSLTPQVTGVSPWHINADENPLFDYNDEIKDGAAEQTFEEKPDGSALAIPRVMFQAATAQRASDHDPVLLGLFQSADISISKTLDTGGPYIPGQSVTYTLTVSNGGPDVATNIQVTDTPTNLSITGVSGSGCSSLPCTIASLAVGASTNITVTATIVAPGTFDNSASANAAESDPNTANNTDNTGNDGTAAASADVSMSKTLDTAGPYYEGQQITYTLTVANAGPSTANNINVTDTPTNITITGVSGACASLPCTISSIASGGNAVITVTATINAPGGFDNAADADADEADPNTGNNTDNTGNGDTAAASADVSIAKTLDTAGPYSAGGSVTYTITVTNNGPGTANNVTVTDTPTNLTITNVSGACTSFSPCTIANIASGGNAVITVTATIDAAGSFDNSASVTATENDPNGGNNTSNAGDTAAASADVSLTKTLDTAPPYNIGGTVSYTINVANAGPSTATNIQVTDTPTNLTITNVSGACAAFPCTIASLASGANTNITVTATIDSSGQFTNAASADADEADPNTGNNSDSESAVASQTNVVDVTKAVSGTFVQGTNVTYTIVMTNTMTVNQPDNFGHEFTDILPAGLTLVPASFTATSGTTGSVANIFFWDGAIPSGGTVTLTFQATIGATASGQICNQGQSIFDKDGDNQNESSELTDDPSTAAMNDATCFYVVQANVVETTKAVSGTFVQGTVVTYSITMTNNMTVTQPDNFGHEWTDILPAGLTLIPASITASSGTTGSVANIVFWDGSIPSGGSVTLSFQATISPTATGQICNQGQSIFDRNGDGQNEAEEKTDDPSTAANNDPTCFYVVQANVVETTKSVSGSFVQGTNVTFTVTMTNNMTVTQPDNFGHEWTDNLPAGLTLIPASMTASTGTMGSVSNIVFWDGSIPSGGSVTITFQATIGASATGQICNQGQSIFDRNGDGQNEASEVTDDPSTGANNDPTCFTVIPTGTVSATKTVSGTFTQGSTVTYTIVVTNNMGITQANNAGNELTDVLPASLTLVNANATSGTASANVGTNTVTWNGSLAAGASVTITITATVNNTATGTVSNQASIAYDADGNGTNEASGVSDNPGTGTPNDATTFTVNAGGGDSDGDGVPDSVEQAAPNGGDGNGDGIPDYTQSTVASIPAATGSGYLTLQSSCALQQVTVTTEGAQPQSDPGHNYPHGLIAFRAPCPSATFSLYIYGSGAVSSYRKYGPLPPGGPSQWYQLPGATFQVVTVGSLHPRRVDFSLTDGGTGDDTPVDGVIVDQGGPADPVTPIPTASEWALMVMAALLAGVAMVVLKK